MAYLWHGYIAFQKPLAVTAGDWTTALANMKAELDETPNADQPAERWHSVTNGDTTIAEATFALYKLTTANLTTVAGVDMTGAWEPLRLNQEWERSRIKGHYLEDTLAWDIDGYTEFLPETYGTIGVSAAQDTAAIQAAIDAAVANGEGKVVCNGTYQIELQDYSFDTHAYGMQIAGDNVGIQGTGTFNLDSMPSQVTTNIFHLILVGNHGESVGIPGEDAQWYYNNWVKGVTITGTAVSSANRATIKGSVVRFSYVQDFACRDVTIVDGWCSSAPFATHDSSRYGWFLECDMQSAVSTLTSTRSYWVDGGRYVSLINCQGSTHNALQMQSNLDNTDYATGVTSGISNHNYAIGCTFDELGISTGRVAVAVIGCDDAAIEDCSFSNAVGQFYWGFSILPFTRATDGSAWTDRFRIRNNTLVNANLGNFLWLRGLTDDLNTEGTDPMVLADLLCEGNDVTGFGVIARFGNQHVSGAVIQTNTFANASGYTYDNAEDQTVIESNNTLQ